VRVSAGTINVPADYPSIQQAINHAAVNDTVRVATGTYHELVLLNKTVHLVGESLKTTVLDGQGQGAIVTVTVNSASISGFTIMNAPAYGNAVELSHMRFVNVTGNTINSNPGSIRASSAGVDLYGSNDSLVDSNFFTYDLYGVNMTFSTRNRISNNQMSSGVIDGVEVVDSFRNLIFQNSFVGAEDGVDLMGSLTSLNNVTRNLFKGSKVFAMFLAEHAGLNVLSENSFELNRFGVDVDNATTNTFYHNCFICPRSVPTCLFLVNYVCSSDITGDVWDNRSLGGPRGGNYWDNYNGTDADNDDIGDTNTPWLRVDYYPIDGTSCSRPGSCG